MVITPELKRERRRAKSLAASAFAGLSAEAWSELLGYIYDGHQEPQPWATAIKYIQEQLRASWVALMLRPATTHRDALIVTAGRPVWLASESPYVKGNDIPPGGLFRELAPDRMQALVQVRATRAYQHAMGADILVSQDFLARLRICRNEKEGAFSAAEVECGQMLLQHFRRALRSWSQHLGDQQEADLGAWAIDSLRLGIVTLGESGSVLSANRTAEELLHANKGIRIARGMIACDCLFEDRKLRGAIKSVIGDRFNPINGPGIAVVATRPSGGARVSMLVKSITPALCIRGSCESAAAVFIRSPDQDREVPQQIIRQLFGLTPTEAAMALEMAHGATLDEASAALDIRRNTGRTHIRSIFAKVGVQRQTSLVRVILNSVATMA